MPIRCQFLPKPSRVLTGAIQSSRRQFSSSLFLRVKLGGDIGAHLPKHVIPPNAEIPPYPYGPSLLFKQSNKGLYGGAMIQFGNNVSPDTETKTRRSWHPNILQRSLYSIALKKKIKLRVTAHVLKTIEREGGLDEYLLSDKESRIKELGPVGWQLRWVLMRTSIVKVRMREQARKLGLPREIIQERWGKPVRPPKERPVLTRAQQQKARRQLIVKIAHRIRKEGLAPNMDKAVPMARERLREHREKQKKREEARLARQQTTTQAQEAEESKKSEWEDFAQ